MQVRLEHMPDAMRVRRRTVEHVFRNLKRLDGPKSLQDANDQEGGTEMSLHVLACNMKRAIAVLGTEKLNGAMQG